MQRPELPIDLGGSHASPGSMIPLPQVSRWQVLSHCSPSGPTWGGSHCSPGPMVPSPQRFGVQWNAVSAVAALSSHTSSGPVPAMTVKSWGDPASEPEDQAVPSKRQSVVTPKFLVDVMAQKSGLGRSPRSFRRCPPSVE